MKLIISGFVSNAAVPFLSTREFRTTVFALFAVLFIPKTNTKKISKMPSSMEYWNSIQRLARILSIILAEGNFILFPKKRRWEQQTSGRQSRSMKPQVNSADSVFLAKNCLREIWGSFLFLTFLKIVYNIFLKYCDNGREEKEKEIIF